MRTNLVVSARITPLPRRLGDPLPEVWVTLRGRVRGRSSSSTTPTRSRSPAQEFEGLTTEEARLLKFGRDRAFLQQLTPHARRDVGG